MTAEVLTNTITVRHGSDEFTFRVPSPMEMASIGVRARALRMRADPVGGGSEWGLDELTSLIYRGCALFELLLVKATVEWPYTQTKQGPVVDATKFPAAETLTLPEVYGGFEEQLATFHRRGA